MLCVGGRAQDFPRCSGAVEGPGRDDDFGEAVRYAGPLEQRALDGVAGAAARYEVVSR